MTPAPFAAALVLAALSLLPNDCSDEDITGCGDPQPVDEERCGVVGYPGDPVAASAEPSAAPEVWLWSTPRVTLPEAGTGWLVVEVPEPSEWALVVTPPVPLEVFADPADEAPVSATPLDLPCDATGVLLEGWGPGGAWVRIGPTAVGEVTVGRWSRGMNACE